MFYFLATCHNINQNTEEGNKEGEGGGGQEALDPEKGKQRDAYLMKQADETN